MLSWDATLHVMFGRGSATHDMPRGAWDSRNGIPDGPQKAPKDPSTPVQEAAEKALQGQKSNRRAAQESSKTARNFNMMLAAARARRLLQLSPTGMAFEFSSPELAT
ncbi:unnamed protein product [Prorocentrum cordatum]|uniref:Uncharacterized protein n=1 Tax=Prorocentrum cordatum TaxID=2364126 RepID=A0ABN9X773_9DINO|nr:unnamed protein product [Polarella glacialis]